MAFAPLKYGFPGFEGHAELFGPHPFTWKTPTPPEHIWTQKSGLGYFSSMIQQFQTKTQTSLR